MNDPITNEEDVLHLVEGCTLSDLVKGDGIEFEINVGEDNKKEEYSYNPDEVFQYMNPTLLLDDDTYDESQPFELLQKKMQDITPDGKVKKRILRNGDGLAVPDLCVVTIDYNSYLEHNDEPFDSTYIRKKPFTFRLNSGETLPGLDVGVSTMKPNEKSQFLVHPDYAYGKFGCPDRIPANAHVLFEVELKSFSNSGATVTYQALDEDKQKSFPEIYKYASGLCSKGNEYFKKRNYKLAIRDYNVAIGKLEFTEIPSYDEQEQQQKLLLRLYINIAITYNMLNESRKCCTFCNKIYYLTKGTTLQVPAKVYFHNARALIRLSDFVVAKKRLLQAQAIEPNNPEIAEEFKVLNAAYKKIKEHEKLMAEALVKYNVSFKDNTKQSVSDEFKKVIDDICKEIVNDKNAERYKLPDKLSQNEKRCVERISREYDLDFEEEGSDAYISRKELANP